MAKSIHNILSLQSILKYFYIMNTDLSWKLQNLPYDFDFENKNVLKKLTTAHAALAELKGIALSIPNQSILINTLGLQEAKDSSAIENIITTHDDLFKTEIFPDSVKSMNAKEVQNYIEALKCGYEMVSEKGMLTTNIILQIQEVLEKNKAGFRKLPGTALKNALTGETIYTPPQDYDEIVRLMSNLERFMNDSQLSDLDPIVKMAIVHFQFESIHPFYDGNGRTGRIINILLLIINNLLNLPILYLSNYIIRHKAEYYKLLQKVREENDWEAWLLFIIEGIEKTSKETIQIILQIRELMQVFKHRLRDNYKFYSQELLNNLFKHPYTKIEFIQNDLKVTRITASAYLNKLADDGLLRKEKLGNGNYFVNHALFELLIAR